MHYIVIVYCILQNGHQQNYMVSQEKKNNEKKSQYLYINF